ncbi:hypothetical protein T492DRAFT_892019 [Pavlovales sp. CCMP2436]|nr:hypothetical protein T492DRAFT_892019 [Pavlovales sp. CCMP2436]
MNEDSLNDLWEGHSLVPLGNRLVVFGGNLANSLDSALHCFDLQRRRWSDLAVGGEHPRGIASGHAAIPCGGGHELFNDTFLLRSHPGGSRGCVQGVLSERAMSHLRPRAAGD